MKGVDAVLTLPDGQLVALSVKKVTQRREAAEEGRFSLRRAKPWKHVIEIAYTIEPPEENLEATGARGPHTREVSPLL